MPAQPKQPQPKHPSKPDTDKAKPTKPVKPDTDKAKPTKPVKPNASAMACVAALQAAKEGSCEQAYELLSQCTGSQRPAFQRNVDKHCR